MKWRNVADINDYGENLNCENLHRFSTFSLTNDSGNVLCEHYMTYNHCQPNRHLINLDWPRRPRQVITWQHQWSMLHTHSPDGD